MGEKGVRVNEIPDSNKEWQNQGTRREKKFDLKKKGGNLVSPNTIPSHVPSEYISSRE